MGYEETTHCLLKSIYLLINDIYIDNAFENVFVGVIY